MDACIGQNSTFMTSDPTRLLYDFGDLVAYTCFLGYNYSSGDLQRTCQTDGSWTGTLPECVSKCWVTEHDSNITFLKVDMFYDIQVHCIKNTTKDFNLISMIEPVNK